MRLKCFAAIMLFIGSAIALSAQPVAFPGAEGHGRYATGGRGGRVIEVTNLNNSGEGSLRAAVEASGARTVVFRVSGTIGLERELSISNDNITIAGQTAPGDGITLRDYSVKIEADNVVIRFLRFRMGDAAAHEGDALWGRYQKNIIIDHCSMSWSTDECVSFYQNSDFTLQWCLISESLRNSVHDKGAHGYGGIWGGKRASFHHNLLAHHSSRNPRLGENRGSEFALTDLVDLRNNVIYNWGGQTCYGGEAMNVNIVNCYYKPGPASSNVSRIFSPDKLQDSGYPISDTWGKFYVDGNVLTASERATEDNWTYGVYNQINSKYGTLSEEEKAWMRRDDPLDPGKVTTHSAEEAYELVLRHGGASLERDTIDLRVLHDLRTGTATVTDGGNGSSDGIIDTQEAVGGWPELESLPAPPDSDSDGMPDEWELARGLDPGDPEDRNEDRIGDGYTNLEEYLYSLVSIPWEMKPWLTLESPAAGDGFLLDDTVEIKAMAGLYKGGIIASFDLFIDQDPVFSLDTCVMDTFLTGLAQGAHILKFVVSDDMGNQAIDSLRIFTGSRHYELSLSPGQGEGAIEAEPAGSTFVEGSEVSLTARPALSYMFSEWTGDALGTESPLVITMDGDKTVGANFSRDTGLFARINFQPVDSDTPEGYLPDAGKQFGEREGGFYYGWTGADNSTALERSGVEDPRKATFNQMQKNGAATWELGLPEGRYAVHLHMGDGRLTSQVNSVDLEGISLLDTVESSYFNEFYVPDVEVTDGALTLVPTGENVKINFIKIGSEDWIFGRYLVVIDGTGDGDHPVGSEVEVEANVPYPGMAFKYWSGDTSHLADAREPVTTLLMPDTDLMILANYWLPVYTLKVNNGTGSGTYERGTKVFITANVPEQGYEFSSWEVISGPDSSVAYPDDSFTWITMPEEDMEVTAHYSEILGIDLDENLSEGVRCYPNPAGDYLYIESKQVESVDLRILDSAGRTVYSGVISGAVHRLDTSGFARGIYMVRVSLPEGDALIRISLR